MKKLTCLALAFAACAALAAPVYRDLPSNYVQVEYISSTGAQYIDTGVAIGKDVAVSLDFVPLAQTGDVNVGTMLRDDNHDWRFFNYSGGCMFDVGGQRIGYKNETKLATGTRYTVEFGNAYLRIFDENGTTKWTGSDARQDAGNLPTVNVFVCGNNNGNGASSLVAMSIYALKMEDLVGNSVQLVRDFVPCVRASDGEPGLYDLVGNQFYANPANSAEKFNVGPVVESPDPVAGTLRISSFDGITPSEATVSVEVRQIDWTGDAVLTLRYGDAPDSMPYSVELSGAAAVDTYQTQLVGLRPGRIWYVSAELAPAAGDAIATLPKNFQTVVELESCAAPGLMQGYVTNKSWDKTFDIAAQANYGRTLGAIAAHESTSATWPVYLANGTTATAKWGDNTTFGYTGFMRLSGDTLTVGAKMDDNVLLIIDGTTVIDQSGNSLKTATYTPANGAGWYPIEIRVGNGSGGYGPYGGFNGLCWNTAGYTADDTSDNWKPFVDPGDGTLLRAQLCAESPIVLDGWTYASGVFSGDLLLGPTPEGGELRMYAATLHGLENTNAWTLVATYPISEFDDLEGQRIPVSEAVPSTANLVRFYLYDAVTDTAAWSRTVSLALAKDPTVSAFAAAAVTGTSATLRGALANAGVEGDVTVTATLEPAPLTETGSYTSVLTDLGDIAIPVVDLVPGTTYTYRFRAVNAGGFVGNSTNIVFTTPAGTTIESHKITSNERTVTITAALDLGAGDTTATVLFGPVGGELAEHPATFDADGNLSLTISGLSWGGKYAYRILVENTETSAAGIVYEWTDDTGLVSPAITIYDTVTYTWKGAANGGLDVGAWNDPANWATTAEDAAERPGYPTDGSTAIFNTAGAVFDVTLAESVSPAVFRISAVCDITFRGQGRDNTTLYLVDPTYSNGTKIRLDAITYSMGYARNVPEYYLTNGAYLDWRGDGHSTHNGTVISLSGGSEFHSGSENYPGSGGYHFIIDDSTVNIDRLFYYSLTDVQNSEIVIKGKSPYIYANMFQTRYDTSTRGSITFSIPVGGYEIPEGRNAPVYNGSFMNDELWGSHYYTGVDIRLDPQSPAIKQGGKSLDQLLIASGYFGLTEEADANGQRHPLLFFDNSELPEGCYFYFTDSTGNVLTDPAGAVLEGENIQTARQLWCHIKSQTPTLLIFR